MGAGGFSNIVLINLEAYLFVHCCTLWMVEGYTLWSYMFAASLGVHKLWCHCFVPNIS